MQIRNSGFEPCGRGAVAIGAIGRYGEWLTEDGLLRIEAWAAEGLNERQIAEKMGIGGRTFETWKARFPAITASLKKGKAPVDRKVENALLKRACGFEWTETVAEYGYSETETDEDGSPKRILKSVREIRRFTPPDTGAAAFWLKNRRSDRWREKREEQIKVTAADYSLLEEAKEELTGNA